MVSPRAWSGPAWGLAVASALVAGAAVVPVLAGVDVHAGSAAPLIADWRPRLGWGTPLALAVGWLALSGRVASWADRLSWPRVLLGTYVVTLAWLLGLALVDGTDGIAWPLTDRPEYLPTARATDDIGHLLRTWVERIPLAAPDHLAVHVAGHPPGAVLTFVGLDRVGLGSGLAAGLLVTLLAASTPVAVATTGRLLGAGQAVRRALPAIALAPAAIWAAVSADGYFAATAAWGLAALAAAATAERWSSRAGWSVVAGLVLGWAVMLSYGLLLLGLLALGVLLLARRWSPLPVAAVAASAVVLVFAHLGFRYWEALPVLRERYYAGVASARPWWYWVWADLAVFAVSAGPALVVALGHLLRARDRLTAPLRSREPCAVLGSAAVASVFVADLTFMSKGEVERIWLPFVPWALLLTAHLPPSWRRRAVALQVLVALVVQHLLWSRW